MAEGEAPETQEMLQALDHAGIPQTLHHFCRELPKGIRMETLCSEPRRAIPASKVLFIQGERGKQILLALPVSTSHMGWDCPYHVLT